jgi:hypothetical protein
VAHHDDDVVDFDHDDLLDLDHHDIVDFDYHHDDATTEFVRRDHATDHPAERVVGLHVRRRVQRDLAR